MTLAGSWVRRVGASPASAYVAAVAVRTAARGAWGLVLPAMLSVAAYGRYQLLITLAAMAAQLAVLGAPQTIVRHAVTRLPLGGLFAHALALAAVVVTGALLVVPAARGDGGTVAVAVTVIATVGALLLGATAKARFAFTTSLAAEGAGAIVLVSAAAWLAWTMRDGAVASPASVVMIEGLALATTAAVFLAARRTRLERADRGWRTDRTVLGHVYSVGVLVALDFVLFRRLEVYFLERSPDGLAGVAVLGLAIQMATVMLVVPTSLLEAWQPRLALVRANDPAAFRGEVARRQRQFALLILAVAVVGTALPFAAVPLFFPRYLPWVGYIVAFVGIRLLCAGAGFYSAALYAVGEQRWLYLPAAAGAALAIALNATLTVRLGLNGAVAAYGATQVVVAVLTIAAYRRAASGRPGTEDEGRKTEGDRAWTGSGSDPEWIVSSPRVRGKDEFGV